MSFYDYSVTTPRGEEISMKDYAGKVVMVVNTGQSRYGRQYRDRMRIHTALQGHRRHV